MPFDKPKNNNSINDLLNRTEFTKVVNQKIKFVCRDSSSKRISKLWCLSRIVGGAKKDGLRSKYSISKQISNIQKYSAIFELVIKFLFVLFVLHASKSNNYPKYQGEVKWAVILTTNEFVYSLPDDLGSSCWCCFCIDLAPTIWACKAL